MTRALGLSLFLLLALASCREPEPIDCDTAPECLWVYAQAGKPATFESVISGKDSGVNYDVRVRARNLIEVRAEPWGVIPESKMGKKHYACTGLRREDKPGQTVKLVLTGCQQRDSKTPVREISLN